MTAQGTVQAKPNAVMEVGTDVMIELSGVNKWYGQFHVLKDINLTVYKGERIVICGRQAPASRP